MQFENIPQYLKDHQKFCLWHYETTKDGRLMKIPYNPKSLNKAQSNNLKTFSDFETAKATFESEEKFDGLGIKVTEDIVVIDLDHCVENRIPNEGYGENEFFTSVEEMVMYCVEEKVISDAHGKELAKKYFKNPQATDIFLDKKLVDELKGTEIDFSKYYILETIKPANAVLSTTKKRIVYLAPYYFTDGFMSLQGVQYSRFSTVEKMLKWSVYFETLTKKQAKAITDYYYDTKEDN